jgi:hypothetical protein
MTRLLCILADDMQEAALSSSSCRIQAVLSFTNPTLKEQRAKILDGPLDSELAAKDSHPAHDLEL